MNNNDAKKPFALIEEVDTAIILIKKGMIEIQGMKTIKTPSHKHIPLLLLSNGFERILKCILLFNYFKLNNAFPDQVKYFKKYENGHGLSLMIDEVIKIGKHSETMMKIPLSQNELLFLETDKNTKTLFYIFTNYATSGRYFHLEVITNSKNTKIENAVTQFENFRSTLYNQLNLPVLKFWENIELLNNENIFILAKITRSLARYFTHADFGHIASKHFSDVSDFLNCFTDADLRKMNYLKL